MIKYLALELRRSLRDRRYLLLVAGWPVAAYLLFSTVFGAAADRSEGLPPTVAIMVAMASFGAMGGVLMASGPRLAMDRQMGWLRQLRLTPLSPARILAARLISAMALSLPAIVLTFIAAVLVKGVTLPLWEWPLLVLLIAAGCLPFAAIGIVVGTIADGDGAQGLTMVLYLVLAALGRSVDARADPPVAVADRREDAALVSPRAARLAYRAAASRLRSATRLSCSHGLPAPRSSRSPSLAG